MSMTVLLADRETGLLEHHLRQVGFEIAEPGRRPDLVIVADDAELERWRGEAPVIVLGRAQAAPADRVLAFRRGCDDYVPRPFHYEELVERMRAVLRRSRPPAPPPRLLAGPIAIDTRTRVVTVLGKPVVLSAKEYELLVRLATDPRRVFTKQELLRDVWGFRGNVRTRTIDIHACRLRRKLRAADETTAFVDNDWGVGYRLLGVSPSQ
jgi:DNA-binding response OmpR family regulator